MCYIVQMVAVLYFTSFDPLALFSSGHLSFLLIAFLELRPFENFSFLNFGARFPEKHLTLELESLSADWR